MAGLLTRNVENCITNRQWKRLRGYHGLMSQLLELWINLRMVEKCSVVQKQISRAFAGILFPVLFHSSPIF